MTLSAPSNLLTGPKPLSELNVVVVSDAAPQRNGVGAYYHDLNQHIEPLVKSLTCFSPVIVDGVWKGGLMLPLPGDSTQRFCIPHFTRLRQQMAELQPDVVIVPTPGLYGMAGARYGKQLGARVLVGFHTWYEKLTELYWNRWQGSITRGYFYVSNKILFRYADCVLANSEMMIDIAKELGARATELVGTPVSYEFIHQPVQPCHDTLDSILFAGRLAAEKNIESIIAAAEALPQVHFSIAGDGPDKAIVESAAARLPNVSYLGWLNRQQLLAQMDQHSMLALPSHVESFGTIALEAMARQRYTLVSKACGIADWPNLAKGLFILQDDETVTQAIQRIQAMPAEQRRSVAATARQAALDINQWNSDHWLHMLQYGPQAENMNPKV